MSLFRVIRKFRIILNRHQKIRIIELAVMMVIGGFMEMLSVSLMLPFMEAVMDPEEIMANRYVQSICQLFDIRSYRTFLVFLAIAMAMIYILKNAFLLLQMGIQNKFVFGNMFATQCQLFHSYLKRPYEYYLKANSGEILRVIGNDTRDTFGLLTNVLSLISEMVVSAVLIVTVFLVSPIITLGMAALLLVMSLLIMKILRPVLRKAGNRNQQANARMQQWLIQAIQGIKELKIMRKEEFFEDQYRKNGKIYVRTTYMHNSLQFIPRFMIEAAAMASFFIVIAIMLYHGMPLEQIVPALSVVAMAAIRLLPSVNRMSQSMANVAYNESRLDKMIENLRMETEATHLSESKLQVKDGQVNHTISRMTMDQIALSHISYCYPSGETDVLQDASMEIRKGQAVGVIGASGAGKTTTVDVMLGLLMPRSGHVLVDGVDIREDVAGWLDQIGYIPQSIFLLDGSIRENVAFGVPEDAVSDERVWNALHDAAMMDFVKELPEGLDTQIGERGVRLSGGQKQRIGIARALYNNPSILFFDEATSALDNETEAAIMDSINRLHGEKTLIIIAHRLTTIEKCDMIYEIRDGQIIRKR